MASAREQPSIDVVEASAEHLGEIAEIYRAVVESSAATFDLDAPDARDWQAALAKSDPARGHFLLAALDGHGRVAGYAKSALFRAKAAYSTTCETSVYVAEDARGTGVGRALYAELIPLLERSPLRLAVAGLAEPNPASTALHEAFGFRRVGTFEGVGFKFGRPWDVTWWQRSLV